MMLNKFSAAVAVMLLGGASAQCSSPPPECNNGIFNPLDCDCACPPTLVDDPVGGACTAGDPNQATRPHGDFSLCVDTDSNLLNDCPWVMLSSGVCAQMRPDRFRSDMIFNRVFNSEANCYIGNGLAVPSGASTTSIYAAIPSNPPTMSPVKSSAPTASHRPSVSSAPSGKPSLSTGPSSSPSSLPSDNPSSQPSARPSNSPSSQPSNSPSSNPSAQPSNSPSSQPSDFPSGKPSVSQSPSSAPSDFPSGNPSEAPSSRPSKDCVMPDTGCGFGIWDRFTCQCVCAPNVCTQNTQCDWAGAGCSNVDPYLGCSPGVDCPWIPDPTTQNCISTAAVPPGVFTVHTNAKQCCAAHYTNTGNCIADSLATLTADASATTTCNSTNPVMYYPDIGVGGTNTCVNDNCYEAWMNQDPTYRQYYLFSTSEACCNLWYPADTSCGAGSSGGRNDTVAWFNTLEQTCVTSVFSEAPAYMRQPGYPAHYLFTEGNYAQCCATFAPTKNSTECPDLSWRSAANGGPIPTGPTPAPSPLPACNAGSWAKDWALNNEGVNACSNNFLRFNGNNPTFATAAECCTFWAVEGVECVETSVCDTNDPTQFNVGFLIEANLTPEGTNPCSLSNSADVGGFFFHPPSSGDSNSCSNSCDYPGIWNEAVYSDEYLLNTPEACCVKWFGASECNVVYV